MNQAAGAYHKKTSYERSNMGGHFMDRQNQQKFCCRIHADLLLFNPIKKELIMKKFVISIVVIAVCTIVGVIAFAEMPSPDPDVLWKYITKESPYTKWSFWPDHQGMQPGRAPHGPLHKVFVNDRGINSTQPPVQYGTITVKENYSKAKELKAITVMYKVNGYNPADGDWFWVKYSPDGKAAKFGKPAGCIGCHGTRAKNDFITVHEFN